jgi:hypothetical protein
MGIKKVEDPVYDRVINAMVELTEKGEDVNEKAVAERIRNGDKPFTARTLQKHLANEGASYGAIESSVAMGLSPLSWGRREKTPGTESWALSRALLTGP